MRDLLFLSAAILLTGCVDFGAEEAPQAPEPTPATNAPTPSTPPAAGNAPRPTTPACAFAETFEDDGYTSRWTTVGSKGKTERIVENGNGFVRVTAPDDDPLFFGRTILDDDKVTVLDVRARIRVMKASTKGEVDVFRVVSAMPTVSDGVGAAASIVRPYRGGSFVAETMINENGDGPTPIVLGTDMAATWTQAAITIDRATKTVTIVLGNQPPTTQAMPDRMATGSLALQIGAAFNNGTESWVVDLDDVCMNVR